MIGRRIKGWLCTAFDNFNISVCTAVFGWLVFCWALFSADGMIPILMLGKDEHGIAGESQASNIQLNKGKSVA